MAEESLNLKEQAYDRIRELLRTGRLQPGTKVSTLGLSRRLGISRTPIREALSRLANAGVVREVPGSGVFVHQPNAHEIDEVYGLREVLEAYAAREASAKITPGELEHLEELCLQWRSIAQRLRDSGEPQLDGKSEARWIRIDELFHECLLKAARNRLLYRTIDDMRLMSRTLEMGGPDTDRSISLSVAAKTYRDHTRLLRALRRGDAAAAEVLMRKQIRMGCDRHLEQLRRQKHSAQSHRPGQKNRARRRGEEKVSHDGADGVKDG